MYDELKERCRACSQGCIYPSECSYFDKPPLRCMRQLLSEAADAIEELIPFKEQVEKGMGLLDKADELLKAVKPRWIPVTERLPDSKKETYWVCTDTGYQCECRWTNNKYALGESDNWGWHIMDTPLYQKVIAWRELPDPYEPPKEEHDG